MSRMPYGLVPPTREDVLTSLGRVVGPEQALDTFAHASRQVGVDPRGPLDVQTLRSVCVEIARCEGLASVIGMSMQVRCETWLLIGESHV